MAEKKEASASVEARVAKLETVVDGLAAKVRGMSENWQSFVSKHIGAGASGGKIVGLLCVIGLIAAGAYAVNLINLPTPSGGTGFVVTEAGNATVGGTFTVDGATTLSGAVTVPAGAIAESEIATPGLGAGVTSTSTVAEAASPMVKTVITITDVVMVATDTSDEGESAKVFDADKGAFLVSLSVADLSCITSAGATNTFVMAFGTAAAGDDSALTGTEVDIIPSTSLDTTGGTVLTNDFDGVLGAAAVFDGTGTAKDIYLNFAIADTNMNANVTNTISGTLTIITTRVIDN